MMESGIATLVSLLDLERLEDNLFRGQSFNPGWQRVYGGQVIAQALAAATRTVEASRPAHSLHGYFMRPGDPDLPIIYDVARDRDGGSFSTRRVIAIQHGQPIFSMIASFHVAEPGLDHQSAMPDVPPPEDLSDDKALVAAYAAQMSDGMRRYFERDRAIVLKPCDPSHYVGPKAGEPGRLNVWFKAAGRLADSDTLHRAVLAYASDMTLLDTSLVPHGRNIFDRGIMAASLDHAMWFHRDFRADDWLLYAQDTPSGSGARGFNRGLVFDRKGRLVASTAQEGLIRPKTKAV
jgi:acyl-CoA thioesterase II